MAFELPKLNYAFNALEPHIDAKTMEIHHGKHHQAYVTNLNNAAAGTDLEKMSIVDICKNISKYPMAVRNNGGGHYNHTLFWEIMAPNAGGVPTNEVGKAIEAELGGFEKFKTDFAQAQPLPKRVIPALANFSLKASKEPNAASIAAASAPLG